MNSKILKLIKAIIIISILSVVILVNSDCATTPPPPPPEEGKIPERPPEESEDNQDASISYKGAKEFSSDTTTKYESYLTKESEESALLVSGGTSSIKYATVTKSGSFASKKADFFGVNAAILVYNGGTLNIEEGTITSNGAHTNAVFAYDTGTINISNTKIHTLGSSSGGLMVAGGGTINANNLNVTSEGNSSAAIRSDKGGGTMFINEGTYRTNGVGSPAIYSTADVTVKNANLIATASEGTIIEGKNKITLENTTLTDTNNTLNGQSETYKNIFIYQSIEVDNKEQPAEYTAKKSKITTNKGDTIYVTNTYTIINFENNTIINNDVDGVFLRAEGAAWGTKGSNGGKVELNATNQTIDGNVVIDNISTLKMTLENGSKYNGTINGGNTAKSIVVKLDSSSTLTLTGDSYVTELNDETADYSNINLNGYKLYVGKEAITTTNFVEPVNNLTKQERGNNAMIYVVGLIILIVAIIFSLVKLVKAKKRSNQA